MVDGFPTVAATDAMSSGFLLVSANPGRDYEYRSPASTTPSARRSRARSFALGGIRDVPGSGGALTGVATPRAGAVVRFAAAGGAVHAPRHLDRYRWVPLFDDRQPLLTPGRAQRRRGANGPAR